MLGRAFFLFAACGLLLGSCHRTTTTAGGTEGVRATGLAAVDDADVGDAQAQSDEEDEAEKAFSDASLADYPNASGSANAAPLPPLASHFPPTPGPKAFSPDAERNNLIEAAKKQAEICHRAVDPNQAGRLRMVLTVGPKGEASQVTATASGTLSRALALCVEGRVKKLNFAPPEKGPHMETFPIVLRP